MDAILASYGDTSSDSDSDTAAPPPPPPPSPFSLVDPNPTTMTAPSPPQRIRTFPHIKGNYAVHVYIPITLSSPQKRTPILSFLSNIQSLLPPVNITLHSIDLDTPLPEKPEADIAFNREFHVSLGRTVPIRVHQFGSFIGMLRQRVKGNKRFCIEFSNWDVFVNDDKTRCFLCAEVVGGCGSDGFCEIVGMIKCVNEVYRLHGFPEFYENPRPHISVAWASGDVYDELRRVVSDEVRRLKGEGLMGKFGLRVTFGGVVCKIGNKCHDICKVRD